MTGHVRAYMYVYVSYVSLSFKLKASFINVYFLIEKFMKDKKLEK